MKKKLLCLAVLTLFLLAGCGRNTKENLQLIEKLAENTDVENRDDIYIFHCSDTSGDTVTEWSFRCTKETNVVRFVDDDLEKKVNDILGKNAYEHAYYSFTDKRYGIYIDSDKTDGTELISYYTEDDKFGGYRNDDYYKLADWLEDELRDERIIQFMEHDLNIVKKDLEKMGIQMEDISELRYADCKTYFSKNKLENKKKDEPIEKSIEENSSLDPLMQKYKKKLVDYISAPENKNVTGYFFVDDNIFVLDENTAVWLLGNRMGNLIEDKLVEYCFEAKKLYQEGGSLLITRSGRSSRDFQYAVFAMEDGGALLLEEGHIFTGEDGELLYSWNGERVSKEEYEAKEAEYEKQDEITEIWGADENNIFSRDDMIDGIE